ncbi:hypothetical protein GCM10023205_78850 [Yinghuangia aomiensis]|uniref:DUF732 domain-containing protein n=1 Tax=Yinghuangia aomiensis TaxID=676205 RepID=A0ABP9IC72_9ACTN
MTAGLQWEAGSVPAEPPPLMTLTYFPGADLLLYAVRRGNQERADTRRYQGEAELAEAAAAARQAAAYLNATAAGIYSLLRVRHGWSVAEVDVHAALSVDKCPDELPVDIHASTGPAEHAT